MTQDNQLTITLTGSQPVKINPPDWPIIAEASDDQEDHGNRKATWRLTVRKHADGRAIVYGIYTYNTTMPGEAGANVRGGVAVDGTKMDAIIAAIQRVGFDLESRIPAGAAWGPGRFPALVHECIADLPAEEI